jgi:uncharacterized protein YukE
MSVLTELSGHDIFNTIESTLVNLETLENNEDFLTDLDEEAIHSLNRVRAILTHVSNKLKSIDPALHKKNVLDNLNSELSNISSQLSNGNTTFNNYNNLHNLNSRLDTIISITSQLLSIHNEDSVENIRDTVVTFRRSVGQYRTILEREQNELTKESGNIREKLNSFEDTLNEYEDKILTVVRKFEDKYNEQQQIFLENQEVRSDQYLQLKDDFRNDFNETIETLDEEVKSTIETLNEEIQSTIEKNKAEYEKMIEALTKENEDFVKKTKEEKEAYTNMLDDHKKSVESLVGIISTNSISGHFKEVADKNEKLTTFWQRLTIAGFLITISFGVYAFIFNKGIDWPSLVSRFIVTTAFGSFTAYSARQVTKNETREKYNRQMEVELKTLNPYIASFDEKEQIRLKDQLFPLIFGRAEGNNQNQDLPSNTSLQQLNKKDLNNTIDLLQKIANSPNKSE